MSFTGKANRFKETLTYSWYHDRALLGNFSEEKTSTGTKGKEAIVPIEFYGQPWRVLAVRDRSGASLALEHHWPQGLHLEKEKLWCKACSRIIVNRIYQEYKENSQSKPYEESSYYWHSLIFVRMPEECNRYFCRSLSLSHFKSWSSQKNPLWKGS